MTTDGHDPTWQLRSAAGLVARIGARGATLLQLHVPEGDGASTDVVLGPGSPAGRHSPSNPYMGATVGRVANRIAGASFVIDGRRHELEANEPPNHLHGGGPRSFDQVTWTCVSASDDRVELQYVSPAGEEGYPGTVEATASFQLRGTALDVTYRAVTDAPTPLSMTNHAYFDLSGRGSVLSHRLRVPAERWTVVDDQLLPTGELAPVAGTPLDLRWATRLAEPVAALRDTAAGGLDHNLVLDGPAGTPRAVAWLEDPASGRALELVTDQPGLQVYTGNRLDGLPGKDGQRYGPHAGICLEPQGLPDAVNQPGFPDVVLRPGGEYLHRTSYRFSVGGSHPVA